MGTTKKYSTCKIVVQHYNELKPREKTIKEQSLCTTQELFGDHLTRQHHFY